MVTVVAQAVISKGEACGDGGGAVTRFQILDPAGWVSSANFDEVVQVEPVPLRTYDATKDQPTSAATAITEATANPRPDQPGADFHAEEPPELDKPLRHTKSLFELRQEAEEASNGRALSEPNMSFVLIAVFVCLLTTLSEGGDLKVSSGSARSSHARLEPDHT